MRSRRNDLRARVVGGQEAPLLLSALETREVDGVGLVPVVVAQNEVQVCVARCSDLRVQHRLALSIDTKLLK